MPNAYRIFQPACFKIHLICIFLYNVGIMMKYINVIRIYHAVLQKYDMSKD